MSDRFYTGQDVQAILAGSDRHNNRLADIRKLVSMFLGDINSSDATCAKYGPLGHIPGPRQGVEIELQVRRSGKVALELKVPPGRQYTLGVDDLPRDQVYFVWLSLPQILDLLCRHFPIEVVETEAFYKSEGNG